MDKETIDQAVIILEEYKKFAGQTDHMTDRWLSLFGEWLSRPEQGEQGTRHPEQGQPDKMIVQLLLLISNVLRNHMNKVVKDTPFATAMDYHFLTFLADHGKLRKSDLIAGSHMEMSSGIEVVKRLLKKGLIVEEENPEDKRSKFVDISDKGRRLIGEFEPRFEQVYSAFCGGISLVNKDDLLRNLEMLLKTLPQ